MARLKHGNLIIYALVKRTENLTNYGSLLFMFYVLILLLVFCRRLQRRDKTPVRLQRNHSLGASKKRVYFHCATSFPANRTSIDGVKSLFSAIFLGLLSLMQGTLPSEPSLGMSPEKTSHNPGYHSRILRWSPTLV